MTKLITGLSLLSGVAGAAVASNRILWPSDLFWKEWGGLIPWAIGVVAIVPFVSSLVSEFGERRKRKRAEFSATLQDSLKGLLITIVEAAKADWKTTGLQVFVVRRRWYWFAKHQKLITQLRIQHDPPNKVAWTKGKGVVGACWDSGQPEHRDVKKSLARYDHYAEGEWNKLESSKRLGLTYKEFHAMYGKYGLIVAFPLTKGEKYLGCITADFPPECQELIAAKAVQDQLSGAAPSISAIVSAGV